MNIGSMTCATLCVIFFLFGLLFWCLKGKAAILISGFNYMPKEKRERYDQEKISRDQRNSFFIWAGILGVGALLSYVISEYIAIIAIIVWLVVFLKDVHIDEEKAFGRYLKK